MSSEWPADVLDWIELVLHLLLRLVASAIVTGMMEIRSQGDHHKHPDDDPYPRFSAKMRKGSDGVCQAASELHENFLSNE
jgi:hypothetical protein